MRIGMRLFVIMGLLLTYAMLVSLSEPGWCVWAACMCGLGMGMAAYV